MLRWSYIRFLIVVTYLLHNHSDSEPNLCVFPSSSTSVKHVQVCLCGNILESSMSPVTPSSSTSPPPLCTSDQFSFHKLQSPSHPSNSHHFHSLSNPTCPSPAPPYFSQALLLHFHPNYGPRLLSMPPILCASEINCHNNSAYHFPLPRSQYNALAFLINSRSHSIFWPYYIQWSFSLIPSSHEPTASNKWMYWVSAVKHRIVFLFPHLWPCCLNFY